MRMSNKLIVLDTNDCAWVEPIEVAIRYVYISENASICQNVRTRAQREGGGVRRGAETEVE